jgi:hypothetical protein
MIPPGVFGPIYIIFEASAAYIATLTSKDALPTVALTAL